jgi:uncharacterized membrane protein
MKIFLSLFFTVMAMLGILDAGYISYGELTGNLPPCKPPFACREVLDSQWSKVGPIPLAVFGLVFYSVMFTLGILSFMDVEHVKLGKLKIRLHNIIAVLGTMGLIFSIWLVFIMAVLLKAWCLYCLLSAINCSILFILSMVLFKTGRADAKDTAEESDALHI